MKRLYILSLLFFTSPTFAEMVNSFSNECGSRGFDRMYAVFELEEYTCNKGEYLPANAIACTPCPNGYSCDGGTYPFNATVDQGAIPNTFTCTAGQFLPANTRGCHTCPDGYTCNGGTFDFNATTAQGLTRSAQYYTSDESNACATNFTHKLMAVFETEQYTCTPGTYLPADAIACVQCPENYYCPGDTYTFNETTDQGANLCQTEFPDYPFSAPGSYEREQCGRRLYIGDNMLYLIQRRRTTHTFNMDLNNDGVAELYGSMHAGDYPMNINSTQSFKTMIDGVVYSIHDDTVTIPQQ